MVYPEHAFDKPFSTSGETGPVTKVVMLKNENRLLIGLFILPVIPKRLRDSPDGGTTASP
jgi:hypothetical protein